MPAVSETPDESDAYTGGRGDTFPPFDAALDDADDTLSKKDTADLLLGAEQIRRGETLSLEEAVARTKARLDAHFGKASGEVTGASAPSGDGFGDEDPEDVNENLMECLRAGLEQAKRGETISIAEARVRVRAAIYNGRESRA